MKLKKEYWLVLLLLVFVFAVPVLSFAQTGSGNPGGQTGSGNPGGCNPAKEICNPITTSTIQDFIRIILEGALKIGIPIVALAIIYSGFLFVKARGNPEELTKAKDALLYTLIGAAILLGSWAIAKLVADTVITL